MVARLNPVSMTVSSRAFFTAREFCLPSSFALSDLAFPLFDVALHLSLLHDSILDIGIQSFLELLDKLVHHQFDSQRHLILPKARV
ncbi:hypothetical protein ACFX2I_009394 [Malus domestica]